MRRTFLQKTFHCLFLTLAVACLFLPNLEAGQASGLAAVSNHATQINGIVVGSVQQNDAESTALNSNASISGNWYVPGTPTVTLNGSPKFSGVVKGTGSAQPSGYYITLNLGSVLQNLVTQTKPITFASVNNVESSGSLDVNIDT